PDGKRIVSANGIDVKVWDAQTGQEQLIPSFNLLQRFTGCTRLVSAVALSADGRLALTGSDDQTVRLWDATTGLQLRPYPDHPGPIHAVAFTPDGKRFLSDIRQGIVRLWDVQTGKELLRFEGHTSEVWDAVLSRDGKHLLTACHDKLLRLFNL